MDVGSSWRAWLRGGGVGARRARRGLLFCARPGRGCMDGQQSRRCPDPGSWRLWGAVDHFHGGGLQLRGGEVPDHPDPVQQSRRGLPLDGAEGHRQRVWRMRGQSEHGARVVSARCGMQGRSSATISTDGEQRDRHKRGPAGAAPCAVAGPGGGAPASTTLSTRSSRKSRADWPKCQRIICAAAWAKRWRSTPA